ncbi:hypothetical protein GCM10023195_78750 [Actinoallomurus liliacearum]|uniref:Uncharacterized protein n=1 Tax=Actinoallomurus liliacearum TaxID=1080073 RepID=A0ABP8TZP6_9ACTN
MVPPARPAELGGPIGAAGAGAGVGPQGGPAAPAAPVAGAGGRPSAGPTTPVLPSVALTPTAMAPRSEGTSELTAVTPTGSLREGRRSWTAVLGVAVVTEALLLWLAGLVIVRRAQITLPLWRPSRERRPGTGAGPDPAGPVRPKTLGPTR